MLIMFINVDTLRLTGTTHNAFYVHLMPVVAMVMALGGWHSFLCLAVLRRDASTLDSM